MTVFLTMIKNLLKRAGLYDTFIGSFYENKIYPIVYDIRFSKTRKERKKSMQKYGLDCINAIYSICKKNNTTVWLEFGSMLGAYREHGFIPYDYDIDLSMYAEDITPQLIRDLYNYGFKIRKLFKLVKNENLNNKVTTEFTLYYKGLFIDIFLNFKQEDSRTIYVYNNSLGQDNIERNIYGVRKFTVSDAKIDTIDFLGIKIGMPSNAEKCLSYYYGENFMTPIKNWNRKTKDLDLPYEKAYGEMIGAS